MPSKNLVVVISIILLILSTIALTLAYKEEIKKTSEQLFKDYFESELTSLSNKERLDFNDFNKLSGIQKLTSKPMDLEIISDE